MRFAIVVSKFNERINEGLREGAEKYFADKDCPVPPGDIFYAPGAFEMPLIAKELAETKLYDGVVCLGSVVKGDTAHFEFVSLGATIGIQEASLRTGVPVAFGVLTTYTMDQALARAQDDGANKGKEAASACWEAASILQTIRKRTRH